MKIKLLKAWKCMANGSEIEHKAGSILEVEQETFDKPVARCLGGEN